MAFKKGDPKPASSGRKPGVKNKASFLVKEVLESHGINLAEQIVVRLPKLSALEQVRALVQLLPYVYPKLTAVQHSGSIELTDGLLGEASNDELDSILLEATRLKS
jgi:hypothetical protein